MDERLPGARPSINCVWLALDVELVPKPAKTTPRFRINWINPGHQAGQRSSISASGDQIQRSRGAVGGFEKAVAYRRPARTSNRRSLVVELGPGTYISSDRRLAGRSQIPNHLR